MSPEEPAAFSVWAPTPRRVRLVVDDRIVPMHSADGGWWTPSEPVASAPGVEYGYLLDDDEAPVADPRSRRQRTGVHGLSSTVAIPAPEPWPGRELAGAVIYELHIGTFTPIGTLDAAVERLDHLVELGVDMVELLPVNAVNGTHNWGYDGVFWFAVHEALGGPEAYARFVAQCHRRGLAVVQDVVYNHLGPSGNVLPRFGPYLHERSTTGWGSSMNLDGAGSPEVRRFIIDNALMWFRDYGVDALRLDAVHALADTSRPHLLAELASAVDDLAAELGRPLTLIAESDLNDPVVITPRDDGGHGITAQWSDDYHHAAHVALTGETTGYFADFDSLAALGKAMSRGFFHDGTWSSFREREHGHPLHTDSVPTWRLVTFTQDHDQIGNRAAGDRHSMRLRDDRLALGAVLTLLTPFTPMLFMGQEWGAATPWQYFTSHPEPELGHAVTDGRLAEFARMGWDRQDVPDPQDPATFERSKLDWRELEAPEHARLLELHRALIRLRRELPALTDPRFATVRCAWDEGERWFRLDRDGVSVVWNFSDAARSVPVVGATSIRLATGDAVIADGTVELGAVSAAVVERG